MARKYKSPGKSLKGFGQVPEQPPLNASAVHNSSAEQPSNRRVWLASRLQMLNLTMFTFFAILSFVQYFLHQAPVLSSLVPGIGFTVILALYIYILSLRRKRS